MSGPKVTVKEIARLAGVSIGTVDRVLHGREGVSEPTRKKVESIIASSGFTPNAMARQLSLGTSYFFRAILPGASQDSGYWAECRAGIELAARRLGALGARVAVEELDRYDGGAWDRLLAPRACEGADALLLAPVMPAALAAALGRLGGRVPYAFFDGFAPGTAPLFAIRQDAFAAGRAAARMLDLLARGPGPLVVAVTHPEDYHIMRRVEGFRSYFEGPDALARRSVAVRDARGPGGPEDCAPELERLFAGGAGPAGILMANASGHAVADWLARAGRKEGCALVSWDLVPANARALREGRLDCVIAQRPFAQARDATELLYQAVARGEKADGAEGEAEAAHLDAPIEIYLKENLPPDGAEGWEDR